MDNRTAKEKAKEILQDAIGCAYYRIADDERIPQDDLELICKYINQYGTAACKAFGREYITY